MPRSTQRALISKSPGIVPSKAKGSVLMSHKRYLGLMICRPCKGKGCERCNNTGNSVLFDDLLKEATSGIGKKLDGISNVVRKVRI